MTERERWVVYPLLFLALGAALRDKLVDRTITKSIYCQELAIVDEEPIGNQSARVLARIGRTDSKSGSPAATLMINGHVEIIADDPMGKRAPHALIRMGRTDPSPGGASFGYALLSGEVVIDGIINAKQYAYQNKPFMPILQMLPGAAIPDLLRGLQQQGQNQEKPKAPGPPAPGKQPQAPPAQEPKSGDNTPPPAPAADKSRDAK